MHFGGSSRALLCRVLPLATGRPSILLIGLLCGYGCARIGHFVFEKNRPARLKRPLYSFLGDWVMVRDIGLGRIKLQRQPLLPQARPAPAPASGPAGRPAG